MTRLVVGCGYLGRRVAGRWVGAGHEVAAVTRDPARAEQLRRDGLRPVVADVTRPATLAAMPPAETVLYSVGYDPRGGASRREVYVEGLQNVLDALPPAVGRVIFISSTGVYGDAGGPWVDEDSPCRPTRESARALLAAEQVLAAHRLGGRAIVLRLAGVYGPGRSMRGADLAAGRPVGVVPGSQVNLIHVDDAAEAVVAADLRATPPRTYNVADGSPVDRREFYRYLAELLGAPPPRFVELPPGAVADRRGGSEKRVANARMLAELGVKLRYPSYRKGLPTVVAGGLGDPD